MNSKCFPHPIFMGRKTNYSTRVQYITEKYCKHITLHFETMTPSGKQIFYFTTALVHLSWENINLFFSMNQRCNMKKKCNYFQLITEINQYTHSIACNTEPILYFHTKSVKINFCRSVSATADLVLGIEAGQELFWRESISVLAMANVKSVRIIGRIVEKRGQEVLKWGKKADITWLKKSQWMWKQLNQCGNNERHSSRCSSFLRCHWSTLEQVLIALIPPGSSLKKKHSHCRLLHDYDSISKLKRHRCIPSHEQWGINADSACAQFPSSSNKI